MGSQSISTIFPSIVQGVTCITYTKSLSNHFSYEFFWFSTSKRLGSWTRQGRFIVNVWNRQFTRPRLLSCAIRIYHLPAQPRVPNVHLMSGWPKYIKPTILCLCKQNDVQKKKKHVRSVVSGRAYIPRRPTLTIRPCRHVRAAASFVRSLHKQFVDHVKAAPHRP